MQTLKRGSGRLLSGEDWKNSPDSAWYRHRVYVPNCMEDRLGERMLDGVPHIVFRLLDEDLFAQPKYVCEAEHVDNTEPFYVDPEAPAQYHVVRYESPPVEASAPTSGTFQFSGKNWKLSGDKKWKPTTRNTLGLEKVGSKLIDGVERTIYKDNVPDVFFAS